MWQATPRCQTAVQGTAGPSWKTCCLEGVPGKLGTIGSETSLWNAPRQPAPLPHLSRPCHALGTVSQQHGKPVLSIRLTYAFRNPMAILRRGVLLLEQGSHLCCPIVQIPENSKELAATGSPLDPTSSHLGSQEEPSPDAEPWQGQGSQLSLASTPGVDIVSQ